MKHFVIASLIVLLNSTSIAAFDSLISSLDFENKPSIDYYNQYFKENEFRTYNDTVSYNGEPCYSRKYSIHPTGGSEFYLTLYHTPSSRHIYNAEIKVVADKEPFVTELLEIYTEIINKYGLPDSAYYRPEGYYKSADQNEYFDVDLIGGNDTIKIKQFFEKSIPFCIIWAKQRFHVKLEVREKYIYRYYTEFFCTITDNDTQKRFNKEIGIIEAEKQAKKEKEGLIIMLLITAAFFILLFLGSSAYAKYKEKNEANKKAEAEHRAKKQEEIDTIYNEYKKQLADKYGTATRIILGAQHDGGLIKHDDDIFIFEEPKIIILGKKEYNFADILSCSIYDENRKDIPPTQVTRTNTGSLLGRAAVGGLTLGVAGAVVGAITAKTESKSTIDGEIYTPSYIVKLGIKSIENPTLTLKYGNDKNGAENVYAVIQAIIAMK